MLPTPQSTTTAPLDLSQRSSRNGADTQSKNSNRSIDKLIENKFSNALKGKKFY